MSAALILVSYGITVLRDLHSFPTRRSSDLAMTRRAGLLLVAALLAGHDVAAQADSGAARPSVLVRAGRLIAVRTGTVLTNQAILIEGDRIKEVGRAHV